MTHQIEPARKPASERRPALLGTASIAAVRRRIAPLMAWARLSKGSLRFGQADAAVALDPPSRGLLWHTLVEMISAIGVLAMADGPLEAGLAALASLAERMRAEIVSVPPRAVASPGGEPPQIFLLEILQQDLQPCLGRWQARLEAWCATGRRQADWPLRESCRGDLSRTRERLVERAWQLGMALSLPGLERLLPERPTVVPVLTSPAELAITEAAAATPAIAAALTPGWQIYVEAATRIPARGPVTGPGAIGEAIASLDMLAEEIRAGLKAMPAPEGGADGLQALALDLLTEGIAPFLAEWRPRWRKFAASGRPEAKWGRTEACRAALETTCTRSLPIIRALGRKVGAPPLPELRDPAASTEDEAPLQLPPPLATRP